MEQSNNKNKQRISKIKAFIEEFKTFVKRGNVMDLAIAVIMGTSFSSIVNSLVNDIVMPLIGILIGGIDFTSISITLGDATIYYGRFIQNVINFLVIAFVIFLVLRFVNKIFKKHEEKEKKVEIKKSSETLLLEEIRDLLKNK